MIMEATAITTTEAVTAENSVSFFERDVTLTGIIGFYFKVALSYVIIFLIVYCSICFTIGFLKGFLNKDTTNTESTKFTSRISNIIFVMGYILNIKYSYSETNMGAVYAAFIPLVLIVLYVLWPLNKRIVSAIITGIHEHQKKKAFCKAQIIVNRYIKKNGYESILGFVGYVSLKKGLKKYLKYTYQIDQLKWDIRLEDKNSNTISYIEILISFYFVTISKQFYVDLKEYITAGNRFYENEIYRILPKYCRFFLDENGDVDLKIQKKLSDKVISPLLSQKVIQREKTQKGNCYTPANGQIKNLISERKYIVDDY